MFSKMVYTLSSRCHLSLEIDTTVNKLSTASIPVRLHSTFAFIPTGSVDSVPLLYHGTVAFFAKRLSSSRTRMFVLSFFLNGSLFFFFFFFLVFWLCNKKHKNCTFFLVKPLIKRAGLEYVKSHLVMSPSKPYSFVPITSKIKLWRSDAHRTFTANVLVTHMN